MSTTASEWSDTATTTTSPTTSPETPSSFAAVEAAPREQGTSNHDVWDAWPVRPEIFGEASVTARRMLEDPMGLTDDGQVWSARVDAAVTGFDRYDRPKLDDWINTHTASVTPELYEARIVAAWESRHPAIDDPAMDDAANDLGADPAAAMESTADVFESDLGESEPVEMFTAKCYPCELEDFVETADRGEAEYLAAIHNGLHHGGRDEAFAMYTPESDELYREQVTRTDVAVDVDEDGWS